MQTNGFQGIREPQPIPLALPSEPVNTEEGTEDILQGISRHSGAFIPYRQEHLRTSSRILYS